ncbi:MAG: protein phosphatase 2C domain-containing protein [Candidatus Micrarchaeia archaeon]
MAFDRTEMQWKLQRYSQMVRESRDPIAKGKEVLAEQYERTAGVADTDVDRCARFELLRSAVLQAVYESLGGSAELKAWLEAGRIGYELAGAKAHGIYHREHGMEEELRKTIPDRCSESISQIRIRADNDAIDQSRFMGALRMHEPGFGYAVSVRKREAHNQDSFLLDQEAGAAGVADGIGSLRFSAIASHLSLKRAAQMAKSGLGRREICAISDEIACIINDQDLYSLSEGAIAGSTTMAVGVLGSRSSDVFKVGDSLPFRVIEGPQGPAIEMISQVTGIRALIGQSYPLEEDDVERFHENGGMLIFTTDGVTNYIPGFLERAQRIVSLTDDPVFIAEILLRTVLRNQAEWLHCDDTTIVVTERRKG